MTGTTVRQAPGYLCFAVTVSCHHLCIVTSFDGDMGHTTTCHFEIGIHKVGAFAVVICCRAKVKAEGSGMNGWARCVEHEARAGGWISFKPTWNNTEDLTAWLFDHNCRFESINSAILCPLGDIPLWDIDVVIFWVIDNDFSDENP